MNLTNLNYLISQQLHSLVEGHRETTIILSISPRASSFLWPQEKTQNRLNKIKSVMKTSLSLQIINERFVLGVWKPAREQNLQAGLAQTNSTAQSYQIPVLAPGEFKHRVPTGGRQRKRGGVIEEKRQKHV